jgi:hypothetical protein
MERLLGGMRTQTTNAPTSNTPPTAPFQYSGVRLWFWHCHEWQCTVCMVLCFHALINPQYKLTARHHTPHHTIPSPTSHTQPAESLQHPVSPSQTKPRLLCACLQRLCTDTDSICQTRHCWVATQGCHSHLVHQHKGSTSHPTFTGSW